MLQLVSTSDLIDVVTSAAADIEPHVSWVANTSGVITPGRTNTASITTATTTTILPSPASGDQYRVKLISLRNNHASTACDVTVRHTDGTNIETLIKVTLLAGEALHMDENSEWHHLRTDGGEYPPVPAVATQAQMEAATSLVAPVPVGRQRNHPAHPKFWIRSHIYNGVPVVLGQYNLTSITDTAAGRTTFVIATDFSSANYAILVMGERSATSLTVTNLKYFNVRNATPAVGSFELETYDGTAVTHVQEDVGGASIDALALGDQ